MEFIRLREEHLETVLRWRTSEQVTRYMYTDIAFDMEKQLEWFRRVSQADNERYWVFRIKNQLAGVVSMTDIHPVHQRCMWAFYIGQQEYSMIAGRLAAYMYNYGFTEMQLHKMSGEVMADNLAVRKMHVGCGCTEFGPYKDHVKKHGKFHDIYYYEMTADKWQDVGRIYSKYIGSFEE